MSYASRVVVLALTGSLIGAAGAQAASVTQTFVAPDGKSPFGDRTFVELKASPGEANRVVVQGTSEGVRFSDALPLEAGQGCEAVGEREVLCRPASWFRGERNVVVSLGDGDDTARASDTPAWIIGGAGDDRLDGGELADRLDGGPGHDEVVGHGGSDSLVGPYQGEVPSRPDVFDGGQGDDLVTLAETYGDGVVVDLAAGRARSGRRAFPGSRFSVVLASIESIDGSSGDDRLLGDAGPNRIYGGSGSDLVDGGDGNDQLDAGSDAGDEVRAGAGDDEIAHRDRADELEEAYESGAADAIDCGAGADQVTDHLRRGRLAANCEDIDGVHLLASLRRPASAHLRVPSCVRAEARCQDTLSIYAITRAGRAQTSAPLYRREFVSGPQPLGRDPKVRLGRSFRTRLRLDRTRSVLISLRPGRRGYEVLPIILELGAR